jgi:hypothetical protein
LGVLVVVVSFGVVGGEFAGVDLNHLALPLGVVLFASGSPGEISPFRHFAIWRACATDLMMTRLFSIL